MSVQITTAFVQQYKSNVIHLYQRRGAKLRGTTRMETVNGKNHFFERLAETAAVKKTTRHGDTPIVNSEHSRRMVVLVDFEWADLVDQVDKIRLLITPESEYAINAAVALGRAWDQQLIEAFDGDARAGETGTTIVPFAGDNAGDLDKTAAAITTADILDTKTRLDNIDVPPDMRTLVVSPEFLNQLLSQSTSPNASSADFNTIRALVRGELDTWVGFRWIMHTGLPIPAVNERFCYAYHRDTMGVGMGADIQTRIVERPDKSFSIQVYVSMTMDATRVQNGIVRLKIDETN